MTRKIAVVLACVLVASFAFAQTAPPAKKAVPAAGAPDGALMKRILDAWSSMNTDNVKQYYDQAPANVFYDVSPVKFVGFKAYAEGVEPMFKTLSSLKFTMNDDLQMHQAGNLAWGTVTVKTVMTDKAGKATNLDCRWTAIWQRKGPGWVIVHDHFSAPMPE